ncbi:prospero homeobox protein 1-like [Chiloscyllium plagiosum]|uniref:prospero homeobox protein 1-like n=1 Tax=Chiloscyllium plagiosum TaxID=36176 RepID=UPI001CB823AD|nr:prospero homeobox protein 1-like [Chiloscyllium plagiosum]XP_043553052.1 prospero homeobox protein 1-like [Chiloscyllium plagiosum]XP_043553054.1 prospero homeobox protein 1-like [Chiloscyllium plagiosum]XP_043553055.1 prospero homeobox protein 1-like [Chiloscyllium plagiosum]
MNHNISKQEMQSSSSCYAEGDKTNQLSVHLKRNAFEDSVPSHSSRAIISHFLGKATKKNSLTTQDFDFSSRNLSHSTAESFQEDRSSDCSKDSVQDLGSPFSQYHISTNTEGDRLLDKHLQAKRARVENIIRGMSSSPNTILNSELERDCCQRPGILGDRYKENKRKQRLPQQQQKQENPWKFPKLTASLKNHKRRECHKLKQQLQDMQGKLLELQEKFFQMYDASESEQEDQGDTSDYSFHLGGPDCNGENGENTLERCLSEMDQGYDCAQSFGQEKELTMPKDANKHHDVDRKFNNHTHFSFSLVKGGYLADALKYELTNAVAHIVDSAVQLFSVKPSNVSSQAFQSLPASLPKGLMPNENSNLRMASHDLRHSQDSMTIRRCYDNSQSPSIYDIQDQTEAIPLVVRKSSQNQSSIGNSVIKQACQMPNTKIPLSLALGAQMPLTELPEPLLRYGAHNDIRHCLSATEKDSSSESTPPSWDAVKMRSKVISHHMAEQPFPQLGRSPAENLCLSRIKSERGELHSMEDVTPFKSVNDGLTPNHLKKAKLMFFYIRYPSSTTLKTYFLDVKFNRCITSQLIKWFSNFREFYYIQMEKFARQAVNDGITNANDLKVTRDTELYRALNMHYNKANDFQIPKQFLEVAEVTLREFFNAIYSGKDSDPSWKKNIYKVICKLDSEVPEIFNSQGSLQDILYN